MPEPLVEAALPEEPDEPAEEAAEPEATFPDAAEVPISEPASREAVPEPEMAFGDTPLSAIERLAIPGDLSPAIRRRDRLLTAAWAASFALLAGLGVAGYTERDRLMREWPASKRVYATLGLAPPNAKIGDTKAGDGTATARVGDAAGADGPVAGGQGGDGKPADAKSASEPTAPAH